MVPLQEYEVVLTKGEKGLGFTLAGGQHTTGYFYVKDILYEPALSCPELSRGDQLLRVRGKIPAHHGTRIHLL